MPLAQLINRPCTIHRRLEGEAKDELGNAVIETVETETVCELQQQSGGSFRSEGEGELSETRWVIYLMPDQEVGLGDSIDVEGDGVFEIFGEPWKVRNPRTGQYSHIAAPVRRTAGPGESPGGGL